MKKNFNIKSIFAKRNRKQLLLVATMIANVGLGLSQIILSCVQLSLFLGFSGVFNIILALGKFYALEQLLKVQESDKILKNTIEMKSINRINNCTLICAFLFFSFGIVITFFYEDPSNYGMAMIFYIAAISFAKVFSFLVSSIVNLRKKSGVQFYIKLMSATAALISLAVTQRAIIYFVEAEHPSIISGIGSIVFSFIAILIGLYMIMKAQKEKLHLIEQGLIEVRNKNSAMKNFLLNSKNMLIRVWNFFSKMFNFIRVKIKREE